MSETTLGAGFATLAIHAGARPGPTIGSRLSSFDPPTTFALDGADPAAALDGMQGFGDTPSRPASATVTVLEERIAALEGGTAALAVASGYAAQMLAFQTLLQPGDEFVAARRFSGDPADPFEHAFKSFGWSVRWAEAESPQSFVEALSDRTKAIFIESIATPSFGVTDIEAIAAIARRARLPLIVDNTLATPYLMRPFEHGADIIVHSGARHLAGHGRARGGLIVDGGSFSFAGDARYPVLSLPSPACGGIVVAETFGNFAFAVGARALHDAGAALSGVDAFAILTGIETLALRMQRHGDNALAVARHLASHPRVKKVRHPGLEGDPGHALAQRYCPRGLGAAFAFDLGGKEAARSLVAGLKLFSNAAMVGDTRSLVIHPAQPDRQHNDTTRAGRGLVRVSIGLEDVADIIADLDQALAS